MSVERIDLKSDDGVLDLHVFTRETGVGPWPAMVLYMDAFGVRPELAGMAGRWLRTATWSPFRISTTVRRSSFQPNVIASEGPERERFKGMIASINPQW